MVDSFVKRYTYLTVFSYYRVKRFFKGMKQALGNSLGFRKRALGSGF